MMSSWTLVILLLLGLAGTLVLIGRMVNRPVTILYGLALVVSIVGINVHVGVTIYLSRVMLAALFVAAIVRSLLMTRPSFGRRPDDRFLALFSGIILVQFGSILTSDRVADGFRESSIYLSMMCVFLAVVVLGEHSSEVMRAVKLYVGVGFLQGVYGVYQVVGSPRGWPTYQSLMSGIPTSIDRTVGGIVYSRALDTFRAGGFFPADINHYAGYMAGVLLISLTLIAFRTEKILAYAILPVGIAGLILSLSRSGILGFGAIGLPVLLLLLARFGASIRSICRPVIALAGVLILLGCAGVVLKGELLAELNPQDAWNILSARFVDLVNPGADEYGSMELHLRTRGMALEAWASRPLLGIGLGVNAAPWYSNRYQDLWGGSHSHHLDALGKTGLLGASLEWIFMALVLRSMWRGMRCARPGSQEQGFLIGLSATYVTILLGNFLYHYYLNDFVWFVMGCGVALSQAVLRERAALPRTKSMQGRRHREAGRQLDSRKAIGPS